MAHRSDARERRRRSAPSVIYLDRIVGSTGERVSWPLASWGRSRFLSEFAPVEVTSFKQSLLAITPYVSSLYDVIDTDNKLDGGVDLLLEAQWPAAA